MVWREKRGRWKNLHTETRFLVIKYDDINKEWKRKEEKAEANVAVVFHFLNGMKETQMKNWWNFLNSDSENRFKTAIFKIHNWMNQRLWFKGEIEKESMTVSVCLLIKQNWVAYLHRNQIFAFKP